MGPYRHLGFLYMYDVISGPYQSVVWEKSGARHNVFLVVRVVHTAKATGRGG